MDSGSRQSSTGGKEEYDDHHFFMAHQPPPAPLFEMFSNPTQPPHHPNPNNLNHPNPPWPGSVPFQSTPNPNPQHFRPSDDPSTALRNPRKRSRASRRTPTTVLTTDTTNFRAMVQEFTGLPDSPLTSLSFPRLDNLFDSRSTTEKTVPPYLQRPFVQGGPTPPFFLPRSATNTTTSVSSNFNYQQLPLFTNNDNLLLSINKNSSNNNDHQSQNPIFTSLLQTSSTPALSSKSAFNFQLEDMEPEPERGPELAAFGLGGVHASSGHNDLPGFITSDKAAARHDCEDHADNENAGGGIIGAMAKKVKVMFKPE